MERDRRKMKGKRVIAGILLAGNNSKIIGVVVNDHVKYEGRVLEDGFVMASLANGL